MCNFETINVHMITETLHYLLTIDPSADLFVFLEQMMKVAEATIETCSYILYKYLLFEYLKL